MLGNLEKGLNADGQVMLEDKTEERRAIGIEMWKQRERQVLYSLVNCCVLHQDFESAVKCLDMLREVETSENMASLHAAYGRVYLQLGSLSLADSSFTAASEARDPANTAGQLEQLLDSAFLAVGQGQFQVEFGFSCGCCGLSNSVKTQVALERFLGAEQLVGSVSEGEERQQRAKMISNNVAVCLLYVGSLKEGLERLQQEVTRDPTNIQVQILSYGICNYSNTISGKYDAESLHFVRVGVKLCHAEEDRHVGHGVSIQLGLFQHEHA